MQLQIINNSVFLRKSFSDILAVSRAYIQQTNPWYLKPTVLKWR